MKITNYKKNGDSFQNLLSLKPIYDKNFLFRYCVGIQFEVTDDEEVGEKLVILDKLLSMLPNRLEVESSKEAKERIEFDDMVRSPEHGNVNFGIKYCRN